MLRGFPRPIFENSQLATEKLQRFALSPYKKTDAERIRFDVNHII